MVDVQGSFEITNKTFDIAIDGKGFFIYGPFDDNDVNNLRYSRAGNLIAIRQPDGTDPVGYLGNETGLYLRGWPMQDGEVVGGTLNDLVPIPATTDDTFPGQPTTIARLTATLPVDGPQPATQIYYFDQTGEQQSLWLRWTKLDTNSWEMRVEDEAGAPIGDPIPMTFDGEGFLTSAPVVNIGGLFDLDVSGISQRGEHFSRGDYFQDGLSQGEFVKYDIRPDGTVNALYTTGAVQPLYKIPVATFLAGENLEEEVGSMYRVTANSGEPLLHEAGGDTMTIVPGAVEMANFDLAEGFTRLIVTQRAYDHSAQVVRTVDEMSQIVRDMKR
jgi:flagellar hook protein FlgE